MYYADAHTEFIHHPDDSAPNGGEEYAATQISAAMISVAQPELLFLAIWVSDTPGAWERVLWITNEYLRVIVEQKWVLVRSKADLTKPGVKIILHLEDAYAIGDDLDRLNELFALGIRSVGLTHNHANQFAGGSLTPDIGMTWLGWQAVARLQELGMIHDLAHLSRAALAEGIANPTTPPLISHTGLAAFHDIPRNIPDEVLSALIRHNGYVGLAWVSRFLADPKLKQATTEDVRNQLVYAQKLAGAEHVGFGSDLGGVISAIPSGLETLEKFMAWGASALDAGVYDENLLNYLGRSNLPQS